MKYGTVGKILTGIGAFLMLYAMSMSVVGGKIGGAGDRQPSPNERTQQHPLAGWLPFACGNHSLRRLKTQADT